MTDTPMKLIIDLETGNESYLPLDADELAQLSADQAAEAERVAAEAAVRAATNEGTQLAKRNRWLFETDPYALTGTGVSDLPADVVSTVQENLTEILAWRQALRDYPQGVTDWSAPPELPAPPAIDLPSGKPLFRLT